MELVDGRCDRGTPNADCVDAEDEHEEEDRSQSHIWNGHHVSLHLSLTKIQLLTDRSICLMTLTRIFVTSYYMTDNFTRQNGIVAFITGLEPIVGIINACLPHFPPVFRRLGSSTFATTLSKVFNTGVSNNASKNSAHTQTVGSYGRSTKNSKKSNQKSGFEQFSDSDTVELTGLADEYLGRDIQVRHDVSVRGSTA
jgi:hypothetical protein